MANNKKPVSASKAPAPKVQTRSATPAAPAAKPASPPSVSTPMRNSAVPKPATPASRGAQKTITHEMIAKRAYEISQSPQCGSEHDNWIRAERELRSA